MYHSFKLYQICKKKREKNETYLADASILDIIEGKFILDVVQLENFLDALLVLQHLLHARLLQGLVAGCEKGDLRQVTDGAHDLISEIADGLVKFVHRSILLFLHEEKNISVDLLRRVRRASISRGAVFIGENTKMRHK